jgi:hypothetical protein
MTKNITMAIEEKLLKKARKIAIEKDTTLTGLIRDYLDTLVLREEHIKEKAIAELEGLMEGSVAEVGEKNWTREDLHER